MFIAIEGPEASGKSTSVEWLQKLMDDDVLITREPGADTHAGQVIRDLLLDESHDLSSRTETFLFLADRLEHYQNLIQPAIEQNKIVVTDRYALSTIVYQFMAPSDNLARSAMDAYYDLHEYADIPFPDRTITLDVPLEVTMSRMGGDDRIERRGRGFHGRVRRAFRAITEHDWYPRTTGVSADCSKREMMSRVLDSLIESAPTPEPFEVAKANLPDSEPPKE